MAKKAKTDPNRWFVTHAELKVMLYAIANDLNAANQRITALESQLAEKPAGV